VCRYQAGSRNGEQFRAAVRRDHVPVGRGAAAPVRGAPIKICALLQSNSHRSAAPPRGRAGRSLGLSSSGPSPRPYSIFLTKLYTKSSLQGQSAFVIRIGRDRSDLGAARRSDSTMRTERYDARLNCNSAPPPGGCGERIGVSSLSACTNMAFEDRPVPLIRNQRGTSFPLIIRYYGSRKPLLARKIPLIP
jgi:hypothetical protein